MRTITHKDGTVNSQNASHVGFLVEEAFREVRFLNTMAGSTVDGEPPTPCQPRIAFLVEGDADDDAALDARILLRKLADSSRR